jgi:NSS family neurotransmitter:Na+ symporter
VIGGWVLKYFLVFLTGNGAAAADDGYFTGFITGDIDPVVMMLIFLFVVAFVIFMGVNKGIESSSKVIMPILLLCIIGISLFALTISSTDADGVTRTGLEGLKIYVIPNFDGMTIGGLFTVFIDALGQLFFSLSIAMGIMIAYGSYVRDDANLGKSINQIEFFDTVVAFLAGMMIIPAVYTFMGTEGMSSGPSLMFISLPKVFKAMGDVGNVIGCAFFAMVLFAAITSAISVMEAVVSSFMDQFHISRMRAGLIEGSIALIGGIIVCLGYNKLYFEFKLPNGTIAQILDIMDYVSNNMLMPVVAFSTCILVGWVLKPEMVISEVEKNGEKMGRKRLYRIMIKFVAPVFLLLLLLQTLGILKL